MCVLNLFSQMTQHKVGGDDTAPRCMIWQLAAKKKINNPGSSAEMFGLI